MGDTVVNMLVDTLIEDIYSHPERYAGLTFEDGLQTCLSIYDNSGYFNIYDMEEMSEEEVLEEALCYLPKCDLGG